MIDASGRVSSGAGSPSIEGLPYLLLFNKSRPFSVLDHPMSGSAVHILSRAEAYGFAASRFAARLCRFRRGRQASTAMKQRYGSWNASKMEDGYTWHYNEDTSTMQLVDD